MDRWPATHENASAEAGALDVIEVAVGSEGDAPRVEAAGGAAAVVVDAQRTRTVERCAREGARERCRRGRAGCRPRRPARRDRPSGRLRTWWIVALTCAAAASASAPACSAPMRAHRAGAAITRCIAAGTYTTSRMPTTARMPNCCARYASRSRTSPNASRCDGSVAVNGRATPGHHAIARRVGPAHRHACAGRGDRRAMHAACVSRRGRRDEPPARPRPTPSRPTFMDCRCSRPTVAAPADPRSRCMRPQWRSRCRAARQWASLPIMGHGPGWHSPSRCSPWSASSFRACGAEAVPGARA
jgi:hypothetical protein